MPRSILIASICCLAAGCGNGPTTAPVSGLITKDGKPLANVSVMFTPQGQDGDLHVSNGRTDDNGRYTLSVTATGDSGAVLGNHIVSIAAMWEDKEGESADVLPPDWVDPIPPHSFTFDVKAGKNEANFDLKSQ